MVNNIQLIRKMIWMLRTYRTCNPMVGFSKYEFYNRLLGGIILFRVTPGITWTQLLSLSLSLYIYIRLILDLIFMIYLIWPPERTILTSSLSLLLFYSRGKKNTVAIAFLLNMGCGFRQLEATSARV